MRFIIYIIEINIKTIVGNNLHSLYVCGISVDILLIEIKLCYEVVEFIKNKIKNKSHFEKIMFNVCNLNSIRYFLHTEF